VSSADLAIFVRKKENRFGVTRMGPQEFRKKYYATSDGRLYADLIPKWESGERIPVPQHVEKEVLHDRAKGLCELCRKEAWMTCDLFLHHLRYWIPCGNGRAQLIFGLEKATDLIALCSFCHDMQHWEPPGRPRPGAAPGTYGTFWKDPVERWEYWKHNPKGKLGRWRHWDPTLNIIVWYEGQPLQVRP